MPNNIDMYELRRIVENHARLAARNPELFINQRMEWQQALRLGEPGGNPAAEIPMPEPVAVKPAVPKSVSGPDYWTKLISDVQEIFEVKNVAVAGGAVRDFLIGTACKDIDIFVKYDQSDWQAKAEELGWGPWRVLGDRDEYGRAKANANFTGVYAVGQLQPVSAPCNVELIFISDDKPLLDRFDLDICKSMFYNGEIKDSEEAQRDREKKTITFCGNEATKKQSLARATRIGIRLLDQTGDDYKFVGFGKSMKDVLKEKKEQEKAPKWFENIPVFKPRP